MKYKKSIRISQEEYDLIKRLAPKRVKRKFDRFYFLYDSAVELFAMRIIAKREEEDLCK